MKGDIMKKGILVFLVMATIILPVSAGNNLISDISQLSADTASMINSYISRAEDMSLAIGDITLNGLPIKLGELFEAKLIAKLAARKPQGLEIINSAMGPAARMRATFIIEGTAFIIGQVLDLNIQLIQRETGSILSAIETQINLYPEIEEYLVSIRPAVPGGDHWEPNNDISTAQQVPLGERIENLTLNPSGDRDYFAITIDTVIPDETLLAAWTEGFLDSYMTVYGPDNPNNYLAENDDSEDGNAKVMVLLPGPGTYWIEVRGYDDSETGPYVFYSELAVAQKDEFEPDNNADEAGRLPLNRSVQSHTFNPVGDEDWYKVDMQVSSGSSIILAVETDGVLDTTLQIYDSNYEMIAEDDDSGMDGNALVKALISHSGRYYVVARNYESSQIGDYTITAWTEEAILDDYEPNNNAEEATQIEINGPEQEHLLFPGNDADWFVFTLKHSAEVDIETSGTLDTYMVLYDNRENLIMDDDDSGYDSNARIQRYLQPGTYYIVVTPYSGVVSDSGYTIRIRSFSQQ